MPRGTIQHWLGAVLVPNAQLDDVLNGLQYDIPPHVLQEKTVLESRVLSRDGDRMDLYTRVLLDAPMVSAEFNLEQTVEYVRLGSGRAWSRIEGTRIAELEDPGTPNEREKPIGNDSGYLWRIKLWWRYVQVDGGVLVECEQLTLSRSIPALARFFLAPIINGAPALRHGRHAAGSRRPPRSARAGRRSVTARRSAAGYRMKDFQRLEVLLEVSGDEGLMGGRQFAFRRRWQ